MVDVSSKPLFGKKKHLIQEQEELFFVSDWINKGALLGDPRIADSYYAESFLEFLPAGSRRRRSKEFFGKALRSLNNIM